MPADLYFTTGQAARELGSSPAAVRALCAARAIECETMPGGQWRTPRASLERLERDGLPPAPRPLPVENPRGTAPTARHRHPELLAEPSDEVVASAEQVAIAENRLKVRKPQREAEQVEDWFRERQQQGAELRQGEEREEWERRGQAEAEALRS